ncbi:MAG: hypothetical protein UR94_C0013G0012 [Parcubacteria group bacterium GW2011_GWA2_36_10]|nr:MAG: hypothetical protein UR94_C0013G0012 [Parcubacteria group bacterium GW2011_GWA2_36_10]
MAEASLHQNHLLGLDLVVGLQLVDVGAAGHGTAVEGDAVLTCGHRAIGECGHQITVQVVDLEGSLASRLQAEVDGRRGVEGVRIVLLEFAGLRHGHRHVDVGGAFQADRFDSHVLQIGRKLESGGAIACPGCGLPVRTIGQIAEDESRQTVGTDGQLIPDLRDRVWCRLDAGVAIGRGTDQLSDS